MNLERRQKINGFTRQKHPFQIFSYLFYLQLIINFSYGILPNFSSNLLKVPINILTIFILQQCLSAIFFYNFAFLTAYYGYVSTYVDPTDELVVQEQIRRISNNQIPYSGDQDYYCTQCDSHVYGTSKHCRACDRCVRNFDHHCKWLNNCIGDKNYKPFFRLIVIVALFASTYIAFAIAFIMDFDFDSRRSLGLLVWVLINISTAGLLFFLDFNLVVFHLWLQSKHITTYDFIVAKRENKTINEILDENRQRSGRDNNIPASPSLHQDDQDNSWFIKNFKNIQISDCFSRIRRSESKVGIAYSGNQTHSQIATVKEQIINPQESTHRMVEMMTKNGICNEVEVIKTQTNDVENKKVNVEQNNFQSPIQTGIKKKQKNNSLKRRNLEKQPSNNLTENSNSEDEQQEKIINNHTPDIESEPNQNNHPLRQSQRKTSNIEVTDSIKQQA